MHVLHFYAHHDPDPPIDGDSSTDAAASAAMAAAMADEPLPEVPAEPAKPADPPPGGEPEKPAAEPTLEEGLADALADPKPAETPEAKAAREKAEADAAAAADPNKAKPDGEKTEEEKAAEAAKAAVEKDITDLGLKDKAAERFRDLSATKAEYEPIKAVMAEVGIQDAAQLKAMAADALAGYEILDRVTATGADHIQYGMALNYLDAANKALGGDMKAAEACYNWMAEEMKTWAGMLGKDAPSFDPLEAHPDLQADLDDGLISRDRALELARTRNASKRAEEQRQADTQRQTQQTQADEARDAAINTAREALNKLGPELAASDPGGVEAYKAKGPAIRALVQQVVADNPNNPEVWVQKVAMGYLRIPAPTAAPPAGGGQGNSALRPQDDQGALRSSGPTGPLIPDFESPEAAMAAAMLDSDKYDRR